MLSSYVRVLGTPRARAFVVAGFVGRLPLAMVGVGTLLLVSASTGSYGLAGAVSATVALAGAVVGPQVGRLVDRVGQRRVLLPTLALHVASVLSLVIVADVGGPSSVLLATAFAMGGTLPSLGSLVRARWTTVLPDPALLHTAHALESVLDDVVFAVGPVLVTVLATVLAPEAGLLAALALTLLGGLSLAAQTSTEPPPSGRRHGGAAAIASPGLRVIAVVLLAVGAVFGASDVATIAIAREHDASALAGPLLAGLAITGALAGTLYGGRAWRLSPARRLRLTTALMCLSVGPMAFVDGLAGAGVALALAGLALTPTIITGFSLVASVVPRATITEAFTWLTASLVAGVALGLAIAGQAVEHGGAGEAFRIPLAAAIVAAAAATLGRRFLKSSQARVVYHSDSSGQI